MTEVYRYVTADGGTGYADRPPDGAGGVERVRPGSGKAAQERDGSQVHQDAVKAIKEAQARIPKLKDYWDYLEFLRTHNPLRFDRALNELKREDPEAWIKLQRHPGFRPLRETALGPKAVSKNLAAGIGLITGKYTGSVEKWLETTVQDMMKQQRYGAYADVLGAKASTSPPPPAPAYSNSRLGQYLKQEDARLAKAGKDAAKAVEQSRAALRTGLASAISRVGGPLVDVGLGALNPQVHAGATNAAIEIKLKRALASGALDEEQYIVAHNLMAQGKYRELQEYLDQLSGGRK